MNFQIFIRELKHEWRLNVIRYVNCNVLKMKKWIKIKIVNVFSLRGLRCHISELSIWIEYGLCLNFEPSFKWTFIYKLIHNSWWYSSGDLMTKGKVKCKIDWADIVSVIMHFHPIISPPSCLCISLTHNNSVI